MEIFHKIFLVIIVIAILFIVFIYFYRRKYTRERYAFAALSVTSLLSVLVITILFGNNPLDSLLEFLFAQFDEDYEIRKLDWPERLLALIFIGYVITLVNRTFTNWDGLISKRQYKNKNSLKNENVLAEGVYEILRILKKEKLEIYKQEDEIIYHKIEPPKYELSWKREVKELVELKWKSFKFNEEEDWHDLSDCWIGLNVKSNKKVAVYCSLYEPTIEELEKFVDYCDTVTSSNKIERYLVLIKEGEECYTKHITDKKIKVYSLNYLLSKLVDFQDYFFEIKNRILNQGISESSIKILDSYVPSLITTANNDKGLQLDRFLEDWLGEISQRQLALLGEYGQGKSTSMLMLTYEITHKIRKETRIPILIELRGKSPSTLQPVELFGAWASPYGIDPRALLKLLQHGKLLIIFEGFDEMSQVGSKENRLNHFRALWKFAYKKSKIIITGRPNFFLDDKELKSALGIDELTATGPHCEAIHLTPFSIKQIKQSLRWIESDYKKQILELANANKNFFEIVSRPSLLFIVAILLREKGVSIFEDNLNSAKVMSLFIASSLKRQIDKQRDNVKFMRLNELERKYFLKGIAAYMAQNQLQNQIIPEEFNEAIVNLYENIPEELSQDLSIVRDEFSGYLKVRFDDEPNPIEEIETDVRTYGILVRDFSRMGALKFPHKSFYEFLFAEYLFDGIESIKSSEYVAIYKSTQATFDKVMSWPESLSFLGELLENKYATDSYKSNLSKTLFNKIVNQDSNLIEKWLNFLRLYDASLRIKYNITNGAMRLFFGTRFLACTLFMVISLLIYLYLNKTKVGLNEKTFSNTEEIQTSLINHPLLIIGSIISLVVFFILYSSLLGISFFKLPYVLLFPNRVHSDIRIRKESFLLWLSLIEIIKVSPKDIESKFGKTIAKTIPLMKDRIEEDSYIIR